MDPGKLLELGPIAEVVLAATDGRLRETGQPRTEVSERFLVDTGARDTTITIATAQRLNLRARVFGRMRFGPTEVLECPIYPVLVGFRRAGDSPHFFFVSAYGVDAFGSPHYSGLIGRDLLANGVFRYDGASGRLELALSDRSE
jgi:hypothetical protein